MTSKIMLMLTWHLYYGGAVITSITVTDLDVDCPYSLFKACMRS